MDFGSLQTVIAWRLTRAAVMCEGIVVHGPEGFRLVVTEDQQIVEWTRFTSVFAFREHVRAALKKRLLGGWAVRTGWLDSAHLGEQRTTVTRHRTGRAHSRHGLLRIAEQVSRS